MVTNDILGAMKKIFLLIGFFCVFCINAEDITRVLQNGLNGYQGCTDSYMYRAGLDSSTFYQNHGNEELLLTAN